MTFRVLQDFDRSPCVKKMMNPWDLILTPGSVRQEARSTMLHCSGGQCYIKNQAPGLLGV